METMPEAMPAVGGAVFCLAWIIGLLFVLAWAAFWIWMLVDCATKETDEGNTKLVWILIILFVPFGALIYLFVRKLPRGRSAPY